MKIYIAGPFFNKEERYILNEMIRYVKEVHPEADLFIPMEHFIPNGETMPNDEWAKAVFKLDVEALNSADLVYACYNGHYSDTGTAWEIGYAYAKNIPVKLWIRNTYGDMSIMPMQSAELVRLNRQFYNQK